MADVDVFIGNNTFLDKDVYHLWLSGYSAQEAAHMLQKRGILQQYGATFDMLLSDTLDHYRNFHMLERILQTPPKLEEQLLFQIPPETRTELAEKYYEFDAVVVREILGKKLSSRNRKELDDVNEKTNVPLKSCRRQFDNIKRVLKTVEELPGSLMENIQTHFLLSEELSRSYAAIVFIASNRFETSKKKLHYLTLDDCIHCASQILTNWSCGSSGHDLDVDLDREFLLGLRDLKHLSEKECLDEHKTLVCRELKARISDQRYSDLDANFKNYSKAFINIAMGLKDKNDLRDFFIDLVEKIIEPLRQGGWNVGDLQLFLDTYIEACYHMETIERGCSHLLKAWSRYVKTMSSCVLQILHT